MSYNVKTTELFLCTYDYGDGTISKIVQSKREIQSEILDRWGRKGLILPSKIQRLNLNDGEEVSFKEFVPKHYQTKELVESKHHTVNVWQEIWNGGK